MEKKLKIESGKDPDCITIDTTDDEDEGYVTIHYEQPNIPALKIPTENNGDLPWNIIQALDSKIIRLTILSKEEMRVLKLINGIIKEPKRSWKSCKVFALVEKNAEINDQETLPSIASSRLSSISLQNEDSPIEIVSDIISSVKQENVSIEPTIIAHTNLNKYQEAIRSTASSRLSSISVKNEDSQFSTNAVNVLSSIQQENISLGPTLMADISAESCVPSITSQKSFMYYINKSGAFTSNETTSGTITPASIPSEKTLLLSDVFKAYNVSNRQEFQCLLEKNNVFSEQTFNCALQYFKRTFLMFHADKHLIEKIECARQLNILYKKLDPSASDFCELCQKSLTIEHLLSNDHLKMYDIKFHKEIPEISVILRSESPHLSQYALIREWKISSGISSADRQCFAMYKNAFICRIFQQNLTFTVDDPFFLERLMFLRTNFGRHAFPETVKIQRSECLTCKKENHLNHVISINHIKNALTQEDLDWICKLLSYIQKDDNGYQILLPFSTKKRRPKNKATIVNGVPQKSCKVAETNNQETLPSIASSRLSSLSVKNQDSPVLSNDVNVVSSIKQNNVSAESSITSQNPETSILDKENSGSANSTSASNKKHISDSDVFAAYKVANREELKCLLNQHCEFSNDTLDLILRHFKRTFVMLHDDKKIIEVIDCAKYTNILYRKLDPSASDLCDLCQKPLTIEHLLSEKHLIKYESKHHQEIPEISVILQPENRMRFFTSYAKRLQESPQFSITSSTPYLSPYKDAFIHRISQKNLTFMVDDPFFLERFGFMRFNISRYALPEQLKAQCSQCIPCKQTFNLSHDYMKHIMNDNHIKNKMTQEQLNLLITVLSFVLKKEENGYEILLPLARKRISNNEDEITVVPHKQSKKA